MDYSKSNSLIKQSIISIYSPTIIAPPSATVSGAESLPVKSSLAFVQQLILFYEQFRVCSIIDTILPYFTYELTNSHHKKMDRIVFLLPRIKHLVCSIFHCVPVMWCSTKISALLFRLQSQLQSFGLFGIN